MAEIVSPTMREFLSWVATRPRTYAEAMEAWQSSCPRHTVWEDALMERFIQVKSNGTLQGAAVMLTPRGADIVGADRK